MKKHICHLTSVHTRFDVRIFVKQCCSLFDSGYKVTLIVADGLGDQIEQGINILDIGKEKGRLARIRKIPKRILQKAIEVNADLYQFHDPELIPLGLKLKKLNKVVVFDSHEDVPQDILIKPYLPLLIRKLISSAYAKYEQFACRIFDGVVAATPYVEDKFLEVTPKVVNINNFPVLSELEVDTSWSTKKREVCYIGVITAKRGIKELVQAFEYTKQSVHLNLVGRFAEVDTAQEVKKMEGFSQVKEHGFLNRKGVGKTLSDSMVGLVNLHPVPTYKVGLPIKMFEYMSAGLPMIVSDFPLWKEMLGDKNCCVFVDPLDPKEIATAIDFFMKHPKKAEEMGANGRRLVEEKYNWSGEKDKLFGFYEELLTYKKQKLCVEL